MYFGEILMNIGLLGDTKNTPVFSPNPKVEIC